MLQFIVNFIWRVVTGKMTEVDDIREEEVLAKVEEKLKAEKAPKEYTKNGYVTRTYFIQGSLLCYSRILNEHE